MDPHRAPSRTARQRYLPESEPVTSLRTALVESLGSRICSQQLATGTVLNMDDLAAERGLSRSVVREAVGVLASLGLVASRRRAGTVVQPMAEWEMLSGDVIRWRLQSPERASQIIELTELRSAIEPAAAALAARHATAAERDELAVCLDDLLGAAHDHDIPRFHVADKRFHVLVMRQGHNHMFAKLHRVIEGLLEGRYRQGLMPQQIDPQALEWHRHLGAAIIGGQAQDAEQFARLIATYSAEEMLDFARAEPVPGVGTILLS